MKFILTFTLSFAFILCSAQETKLRVYFTDKGAQPQLLENPQAFLSEKAISRRAKQNIPVTREDLPVAQEYLTQLRDLGFTVHFASRWFNYALVSGVHWQSLQSLSFVEKLEVPKQYQVHFAQANQMQSIVYGTARNQIEMLNGQVLHNLGFTGQGSVVAVLDGGFTGTNTSAAFDSLRAEGRLLGQYNFVNPAIDVYNGGLHGTLVLSCMAGIIDSAFVGTAPKASYWLLKSENEASETPAEMDNWLAAAEFADSVGADVINSSLGYSTFDDPSNDFTYQDMDGNTTLVTRAADKAAQKGIVVVVSAGNAGNSNWQYITAPADGDSVLTVGAVDAFESYASFSSQGPTFDQRVKPDVVAQGEGSAVVAPNGNLVAANGTSFSSPIMAGLMACLVQASPSRSNMDLIQQVRRSSSQYTTPDGLLGYGIPNFGVAYALGQASLQTTEEWTLEVYPLPFNDHLHVALQNIQKPQQAQISIRDMRGQEVFSLNELLEPNQALRLQPGLPAGFYLLSVKTNQRTFTQKIMR